MTEIKKTRTPRKTTVKAQEVEEAQVVTNEVQEVEVASVVAPVAPQKVAVVEKTMRGMSEIPQGEQFAVRSLTSNPLIYIDQRSGNIYEWLQYGDVEYMSFADITTMRSRNRKFIDEMRICFDSEELIDVFNLDKKYEEVFGVYSLDMLLSENATALHKILPTLPAGIKSSLITQATNIAKAEIESGDYDLMDSTRKIKIIEECLGLDLSLLSDK